MATNSYPARGTNGMTEAQWATMYGSQDGIIEDYRLSTTDGAAMTVNSGTNTVTIAPAKVSVNGYVLDITSATDLSVPSPGSTTTYHVAACYDPALNVAEGGGGRSTLGPCRLVCETTADVATGVAANKAYKTLYTITRASGQALSVATFLDVRNWIGPTLSMPDLPATNPAGFGPWPRGTMIIQTATDGTTGQINVMLRTPPTDPLVSGLVWSNLLAPSPVSFPAAAGLVAQDSPAQMIREGAWVSLRGTLRRSAGGNLTNGVNVVLGTLPVGWRPPGTYGYRFTVLGSGARPVGASVTPAGVVTLYEPVDNFDVTYVELTGIRFLTQE